MQAARGTSLSDDGPASAAPGTGSGTVRRARVRATTIFVLVATVWYAADQLTKVLAVDRLADGDVSVVEGVLTLHLVRNPGAAFSTGTEYTVVLSCFAAAAALVVLWIARRLASPLWALALGLLLGGVVGNLTDRVLREPGPMRGHVIDFLQLPHWPVFNLADIGINVAAGLILVQAFRGIRVDGRPADGESPGGTDEGGESGDAGGPGPSTPAVST